MTITYQKMGDSELTVSRLGLGCMGMSECYGPRNNAESLATLALAIDLGLNFFDTADVYGNGHNETLVGPVLKPFRHEVVLASKFGFLPSESGLNGRPEYVFQAFCLRGVLIIPPGRGGVLNQGAHDHEVAVAAARPQVFGQLVVEGLGQQVLPEDVEQSGGGGVHVVLEIPIRQQSARLLQLGVVE